jgi:hypothetical protein
VIDSLAANPAGLALVGGPKLDLSLAGILRVAASAIR